jgi:SAM-dependent methyltransferase
VNVTEFVLSWLPPASVRVLEIGCGGGELARALARGGYDVLAIDPEAPEGAIFRRVAFEEFAEDGRFAAVVASRSLHHLEDLPAALDKVARLLAPGGVLVLNEFAWDRLDERTAGWYYGQRLALAAARGGPAHRSLAACEDAWRNDHAGVHTYAEMRRELDGRFDEHFFSWEPYLYVELDGVATEALERTLIDAGAIQATGFRYVGTPRATRVR